MEIIKPKRLCKELDCDKLSSFSFNNNPEYCKKHKKDGMKNMRIKKCLEDGCEKFPSFGFEGEIQKFCKDHIKKGMINLAHKKCKKDGCQKLPSFGFGNKREYCMDHCAEGMVFILSKSKMCNLCKKRALFVSNNIRYCALHKPNNEYVEVISNKCTFLGCHKISRYGNIGEKILFCNNHKEKQMIDLTSKKCNFEGCLKKPVFGFKEDDQILYCFDHRKDDMINIKSKKCKSNLCEIQISNPNYKGYCLRCFIFNFPEEKVSRNYKTKEKSVADYVRENNKQINIIFDKIILGGCSKRRPDILMDFGTHMIIVEVDENKHEGYSCENKRMMEISQDLGHPNIVFIRFNPDSYEKNGKKFSSCWKINKQGICVIRDNKNWNDRLNCLQNTIERWSKNIPEKLITIEELFFD
jgi:hypothetical protein